MENNLRDFEFTARELSILKLIAKGFTTPQIADELCLSPETVKWYRKKMLSKTASTTSAEMVRKSIGFGINLE